MPPVQGLCWCLSICWCLLSSVVYRFGGCRAWLEANTASLSVPCFRNMQAGHLLDCAQAALVHCALFMTCCQCALVLSPLGPQSGGCSRSRMPLIGLQRPSNWFYGVLFFILFLLTGFMVFSTTRYGKPSTSCVWGHQPVRTPSLAIRHVSCITSCFEWVASCLSRALLRVGCNACTLHFFFCCCRTGGALSCRCGCLWDRSAPA